MHMLVFCAAAAATACLLRDDDDDDDDHNADADDDDDDATHPVILAHSDCGGFAQNIQHGVVDTVHWLAGVSVGKCKHTRQHPRRDLNKRKTTAPAKNLPLCSLISAAQHRKWQTFPFCMARAPNDCSSSSHLLI